MDTPTGQIALLLEKFNMVSVEKKLHSYNEAQTKSDFIEPLFTTLGWNLHNMDEVTREEKVSGGRVDYGFKLRGIHKFYLEAKSLGESLEDPRHIQQAITYSWNKGCTWAVLTNFEHVRIFNAEVHTANYSQNHLKTIDCSEFLTRFDELSLLSKESFEKGLLDEEAERWGKRTKRSPVSEQLLADFTHFRELLSKSIVFLNRAKNISQEELDESVQRLLDRLIFIRNCEDKEIEEQLLKAHLHEWQGGEKRRLVERLRDLFRYFDRSYDSEIFAHHLCDDLDIGDGSLGEVLEALYQTRDRLVSYDFSAIEADVLGNIYEQYLSHILKKTNRGASLKQSQLHRKEQGIYYTPTFIVKYMLQNTLGKLLEDQRPRTDTANLRILDPACGSGSFLIEAFDMLNDYRMLHDPLYAQSKLDSQGAYTTKLSILENSIFGVDLDKRAVEIAQLNLLLKMAAKGQRLPVLRQNVKCGNSLVDNPSLGDGKAFEWNSEFRKVMQEGGFDVVVGNPPYINAIELSKLIPENIRKYWKEKYAVARGCLRHIPTLLQPSFERL